MSDTPRTNALIEAFENNRRGDGWEQLEEGICKLELELTAAKSLAEGALSSLTSFDKALAQHIRNRQVWRKSSMDSSPNSDTVK